jgi:hypothetical protein
VFQEFLGYLVGSTDRMHTAHWLDAMIARSLFLTLCAPP